VDLACPLCMNDIESNDHIFWECPSIKRVWRLASQHNWLQLLGISNGPQCSKQLILRYKQSRNGDDIVKVTFLTLEHMEKEKCDCLSTRSVWAFKDSN